MVDIYIRHSRCHFCKRAIKWSVGHTEHQVGLQKSFSIALTQMQKQGGLQRLTAPMLSPSPGNIESLLCDAGCSLEGSSCWLRSFFRVPLGLLQTLPSLFPFLVWLWGWGWKEPCFDTACVKSITGGLYHSPSSWDFTFQIWEARLGYFVNLLLR